MSLRQISLGDLKFIPAQTLRLWLVSKSPTGDGIVAVVDVRDSDFAGGHIRGCWHYPADRFQDTITELRERLKSEKVNDVVFHCALSQVRGPKSALRFLRSLDSDPESELDALNVYVLQGGFTSWQSHYGEDKSVTEGYAKDLWQ